MSEHDGLRQIASFLKRHEEKIVLLWLHEPSLAEIFKTHHISRQKFKPKFGLGIIRYFIDVLQGTQRVGECPMMNRFIDYMLHKQITVSEVFLICVILHRTLQRYLYSNSIVNVNDPDGIALSAIFDQNLSGVLAYFVRKNGGTPSQREQLGDTLKSLQILANQQESLIVTLKDGALFLANTAFLRFAGVTEVGELAERHRTLWEIVQSVTRESELIDAKDYEGWITRVTDRDHESIYAFLVAPDSGESLRYRVRVNTMPCAVDDGSHYHVITLTREALTFDALDFQDYDLLTRVYTRERFDRFLSEYTHKHPGTFSVLAARIQDLEQICGRYGIEMGDVVLQEFAAQAQHDFDSSGHVARFADDTFAIIFPETTPAQAHFHAEKALEIAAKIVYDETIGRYPTLKVAIGNSHPGDTEATLVGRLEKLLDELESEKLQAKDDTTLFKNEQMRQEAEAAFFERAKAWKAAGSRVPVVIYYKEVPVESESQVLSVSKDAIVMSVRRVAAYAAGVYRTAFIRLNGDARNIAATVRETDTHRQTIELTRITPVATSPMDRQSVNVMLASPLPASLFYGKTTLQGELHSMSIDTTHLELQSIDGLAPGSHVTLETELPMEQGAQHFATESEILKIRHRGHRRYELVLRFAKQDVELIRAFVSHRQLEIVKELQSLLHG